MKRFILCCLMIFQIDAIEISLNMNDALTNEKESCDMLVNGELHVITQLIKDGMTVFDIGANVGEWSTHVLERYSGISLFAFEPNPKTFALLERKFSEHANVRSFCVAASNCDASQALYTWDSDQGGVLTSLFHRPIVDQIMHGAPKTYDVQTLKLDSFCKMHNIRYINFMKIDTEGSEMSVLLGARELLHEQRAGMIQFEYGGTYTDANIRLEDVFNLLLSYGYVIYKIAARGLIQLPVWDSRLETYNYSNFLAASKSIAQELNLM